MRAIRILAVSGLVMLAVTACADLEVVNLNAPDRERALATPGDVESLIAGSFRTYTLLEQHYAPGNAMSCMADEHTSSWGNFGMREMCSEPRIAVNNSPSWGYSYVMERPWSRMYRSLAAARDGIIALEGGLELGTDGEDNARAEFFAKFNQGLAHGYVGMVFDQGFILTEDTDIETATMVPYADVTAQAIASLEDAIAIAQANTFTIPDTWMGETYDNTELVQICHSYIARFMASVARTPAERGAVDWASVASHASQGITEDFTFYSDDTSWYSYYKAYTAYDTWSRVDYWTIGPADQGGGFQNWVATPVANRTEFNMSDVEDLRVTATAGPGEALDTGSYFAYKGVSGFRPERGTYHYSKYIITRFRYIWDDWLGDVPVMTVEEMNLLRAEAAFRAGNLQGAADLINLTRTAHGGLPEVTTAGVPDVGGICTPRTAAGACGSLWDALMYEKKLEGYSVASGVAYWDDRGWGELISGTPIDLPVPGEDLLTLLMDIYTTGGPGGYHSAPDEITNFDFNDPRAVQQRIEAYEAFDNREIPQRLFDELR